VKSLCFVSKLPYSNVFPLGFLEQGRCNVFGCMSVNPVGMPKLALSPLPTVTNVEAWKRSLSVLSQGMSSPAQGLSVVST
jgi:hypothetical protein